MTKRTSSISNRHKCGHCRRAFYAFDDDVTDLCPTCRQRLGQAMTEPTTQATMVPDTGSSDLTHPWQMEMRFS
ncbi:MAG: hypothetical protein GY832_24930 [Chloroflexi bacterium]|nr:hypothetical protein [Chloroflexota bacterium]